MAHKRTCVAVAVAWLLIMGGTSFGGDNNTYMARPINWNPDKNISLSLAWDYHTYTDTDFFDFWGADSKTSITPIPSGLGYEAKFWETIGLEIVAGYSGIDDDSRNRLEDDDRVSIDLETFSLLFYVKKYWQLTNTLYLFGGIGADVYPNVAKAGGLQRQGAEGEAVVVYRESSATRYLKSSDFPERVEKMLKSLLPGRINKW